MKQGNEKQLWTPTFTVSGVTEQDVTPCEVVIGLFYTFMFGACWTEPGQVRPPVSEEGKQLKHTNLTNGVDLFI